MVEAYVPDQSLGNECLTILPQKDIVTLRLWRRTDDGFWSCMKDMPGAIPKRIDTCVKLEVATRFADALRSFRREAIHESSAKSDRLMGSSMT